MKKKLKDGGKPKPSYKFSTLKDTNNSVDSMVYRNNFEAFQKGDPVALSNYKSYDMFGFTHENKSPEDLQLYADAVTRQNAYQDVIDQRTNSYVKSVNDALQGAGVKHKKGGTVKKYPDGGKPGSKAKLVKEVPKGYLPIPSMPNHFKKDTQSSQVVPTKGPKMSNADWKAYQASHPMQNRQASSDTVYIQPTPAPIPAPSPFTQMHSSDGNIVYGGDNKPSFKYHYGINTKDPNLHGTDEQVKVQKIDNLWGNPVGYQAEVPRSFLEDRIFQGETNRNKNPQALDSAMNAYFNKSSTAKFNKGGKMKGKKCLDGGIPTKDTNPLFGTEYKGDAGDLDKVFQAHPQLFKASKMQGAQVQASPMQHTLTPITPQASEKPKTSAGEYINIAGAMYSMLAPEQTNRQYLRPEDLPTYNTNAYGTGSQAIAEHGATIGGRGGLEVFEGAAPQISTNPFDGGTGMFQGDSHENGGIPAAYDGKQFEAEGNEPYRIDQQGQLEIFGNLVNPVTGNKFKKDVAEIAKKEQKLQKISDKGTQLVNTSSPSKDKFETMKFNSGEVMLKGSMAKQKELADAKNHLSLLQNIMLAQEDGTARNGGIFRNGGMLSYDEGGFPGLTSKLKSELEKKYPGKKIEVKYNELGENRSYAQQSDVVKNQKDKLSGLFSMHNLDEGAKDINIYIDGKLADPSIHRTMLTKHSKEFGLYTLSGKTGDKDPYHVSTVQEGKGTSADQYFSKFPDKAISPQVTNWLKEVSTLYPDLDKAPKEIQTAFASAVAAGAPSKFSSKRTAEGLKPDQLKRLKGENIFPIDTPNPTPWTPQEQLKIQTIGQKLQSPMPEPLKFEAKQPATTPYVPSKNEFPWEQVAPAIPQLFDTADPVLMQKYNPDLFDPYSVSFQDQRNRNTAELNGIKKAVYDNPSALGVLGAQAYSANNSVDAEEFRANQGIFNDIQNKNISLLNEAKQKNLALTDQQYTRQTMANANTKDRRTQAGIQIGDVIAKNSLENKTLDVTKQLYKNYSYDKNMQLQYTAGDKAVETMDFSADPNFLTPVKSEVTTKTGNSTTRNTFMKPSWDLPEANILNGYKRPLTQGAIAKHLWK